MAKIDYSKEAIKLSSKIVKYLNSEFGYSLKEIGELAGGLSESYMSRIKNGKRSFRLAHLIALECNFDESISSFIKDARELY
ncbi:hypothetical protein AMJ47_02670 [Parcubacteria bacterium DG_72]|nr:MAG: hypothetical protein AMJ47_02670 [Parcubacteria bacterium DG_72]